MRKTPGTSSDELKLVPNSITSLIPPSRAYLPSVSRAYLLRALRGNDAEAAEAEAAETTHHQQGAGQQQRAASGRSRQPQSITFAARVTTKHHIRMYEPYNITFTYL